MREVDKQLYDAVRNGDCVEEITRLLEAGGNVNAQDKLGRTTAHATAWKGHAKVLAVLIRAGVEVNARSHHDWTPAYFAAWFGRAEALTVLIQAGAEVNAQDNWGWAPAHRAALLGRTEALEMLIRAGADLSIRTRKESISVPAGFTARDVAEHGGHADIVHLIDESINARALKASGSTPAKRQNRL